MHRNAQSSAAVPQSSIFHTHCKSCYKGLTNPTFVLPIVIIIPHRSEISALFLPSLKSVYVTVCDSLEWFLCKATRGQALLWIAVDCCGLLGQDRCWCWPKTLVWGYIYFCLFILIYLTGTMHNTFIAPDIVKSYPCVVPGRASVVWWMKAWHF